jgi:hypothetical protein
MFVVLFKKRTTGSLLFPNAMPIYNHTPCQKKKVSPFARGMSERKMSPMPPRPQDANQETKNSRQNHTTSS